ncbi:MAG: DNA-formamidopyrimidine glycosylase family protein [Chitinophagaceae bacterium]
MPEGPSLLILKESILHFNGKKIIEASGNAKIDISSFTNKKVLDIRTWGKQLFICLKDVNIRIHLLMFGSYSIDEQTKPNKSLRLALRFSNGTVFFYTCSVKILEGDLDELYDWKADILSDKWSAANAKKKLKVMPGTMVCDALLDQQVFSGVGNIIKNEVLYRIHLHPETLIKDIPAKKLSELIKEARDYSFDFLKWKKEFVLKKHWLAHTKKTCLRCDLPIIKKYCGKTKRRTFFCTNCQVKYD